MYTTTAVNPWQSSVFVPQQQFALSFFPYQNIPQAQGYSMPMQTGMSAASPWGYSMPGMYSPVGSMQASYFPQGNFSYGFNPNMAYQPISPFINSQFAQANPQMQSSAWQTSGIRTSGGFCEPRVELAETNNDVIVSADLPNVDPNNIYITVTDDSLSISALSHVGGTTSSLHRTVALPTQIRSEYIDASYTNGTLECRLPKSDLSVRRRVKVNPTG